MATGFSSDSGNSDDGSFGPGLDDSDDDIVSQFKSRKSSPKDRTWTPSSNTTSKSKGKESPKPSPRNLSGRKIAAKSESQNERGKGHTSNRSPSPDPIRALLEGSKSSKTGKPPVPKPRTHSFSDLKHSVETSPRDKPTPSPRSGSFGRSGAKSPSAELGNLLGRSSSKSPESSRQSTLGSKKSDKRSKSPLDNLISGAGSAKNGRDSPKGKTSLGSSNNRAKSPLSQLLESKTRQESRKSPDLDELLGIKPSRAKTETSDKQKNTHSSSRSASPSSKGGKNFPAQTRSNGRLNSDDTDTEVANTLQKVGRKSPTNKSSDRSPSKSPDILDLFGGHHGSPSSDVEGGRGPSPNGRKGKKSPTGKKSPKGKSSSKQVAKSPEVFDLFGGLKEAKLDGSEKSKAKPETNGRSTKETIMSPTFEASSQSGPKSPLEKLMTGNGKPKKGLLDSDSEEEVLKRQKSPKVSLLDVLDRSSYGGSNKSKKNKKQITVLDSDEENEQPALRFTDRRPKGGYESDEDADFEANFNQSKRLVKPSPQRPKSGASHRHRKGSLQNCLTPSLEKMDTLDSSSIREAMYEEWRARKTAELKRRKKLEEKKLKDEQKKKQKEAEDKRGDAAASFDAWKGNKSSSLLAQKKAIQEKARKEKEEREEKMNQKVHAEKAYDSWKKEKDERLRATQKNKHELERQKTMTLREKEEEKQKDSESAFKHWNSDKERKLKKAAREKREREEELNYTQEIQQEEKDEKSMKAYQDWDQKIEERKLREKKRLQNTKPISPYPFRPSSNTVPFGR